MLTYFAVTLDNYTIRDCPTVDVRLIDIARRINEHARSDLRDDLVNLFS